MSVIASTGAMLLSGHKKHQWEVGLSLPNLILDRVHPRVAPYKFLVPVIVSKERSNAFIEPVRVFITLVRAPRLFAVGLRSVFTDNLAGSRHHPVIL
jgi:hypothetical protein